MENRKIIGAIQHLVSRIVNNKQLTVIARSFSDEAISPKRLGTGLTIFRNEIATPFGLAMTVFLGMRTYDTRH